MTHLQQGTKSLTGAKPTGASQIIKPQSGKNVKTAKAKNDARTGQKQNGALLSAKADG